MPRTARRRWASVLAAVVLVAGCSGSGGKQSTPAAENGASTSSPAGGTGYARAPSQVSKLGPCPSGYPNTSPTRLNAGVRGLDGALVPGMASSVRICRYVANKNPTGAVVSGAAARALEYETNRLPGQVGQCPLGVKCGAGPTGRVRGSAAVNSYLVTFEASNAKQSNVAVFGPGVATNGVRSANATETLLGEFNGYTVVATVPTGTRVGGGG